jgi:hypothetical protein
MNNQAPNPDKEWLRREWEAHYSRAEPSFERWCKLLEEGRLDDFNQRGPNLEVNAVWLAVGLLAIVVAVIVACLL